MLEILNGSFKLLALVSNSSKVTRNIFVDSWVTDRVAITGLIYQSHWLTIMESKEVSDPVRQRWLITIKIVDGDDIIVVVTLLRRSPANTVTALNRFTA